MHDLLENFVGQNFRGMMEGLQKKHHFTMSKDELNEYVDKELGAVTLKLSQKCQPCKGAPEELEKLKQQGKYPNGGREPRARSRASSRRSSRRT